jgi:DNA-binding NarL/FixJ family response regulator
VTQRVRVLLLEMPPLLRGILEQQIQVHADCELLKDTRHAIQILTQDVTPPDVVIVALRAAEDVTLVPALLARWPRAQVMTVMAEGDDAVVYEMTPRQRTLGQMSPAEIIGALREAVSSSRGPSHE